MNRRLDQAECEVKVMKSIFGYSEEEVDAVLVKVSDILEKELSEKEHCIYVAYMLMLNKLVKIAEEKDEKLTKEALDKLFDGEE